MSKQLEALTEEQAEMLPAIRDRWINVGMSTEPCDFEAAKDAACRAYREAGLEPPKTFLLADCPISGALMAQVVSELLDQGKTIPESISIDSLKEKYPSETIQQRLREQIYGAHDAGWLSYYDAMRKLGVKGPERLIPLMDLAKVCGWWAPYQEVVIFQHRPEVIHLDEEGRLHCEDGPAVSYRGEMTQVWAWHGVRVPKEWIISPESIDVLQLITHDNQEQKRVGFEIVGWERALEVVGSKVIQKDDFGDLLETSSLDDDDGAVARFVKVKCPSTDRQYVLRVPPDTRTAREGCGATFRMDEGYDPVSQT